MNDMNPLKKGITAAVGLNLRPPFIPMGAAQRHDGCYESGHAASLSPITR